MFLPSRNIYKCKQALKNCCCYLFAIFFYIGLCYLFFISFYTALCCCLFISLFLYFFILTLLLYFCLLVNHINKQIIFVFGAFVYYFKNTISSFVTIFSLKTNVNNLQWNINSPSCTCSDSHVHSACICPDTLCISVHLYKNMLF